LESQISEANGGNMYAEEELENFYRVKKRGWKNAGDANLPKSCRFIPSITPGFNDLGFRVRTTDVGGIPVAVKRPLSRRLSASASEGSLLAKSIEYAIELVDPNVLNLVLLTR
jgi:hypothetical protein